MEVIFHAHHAVISDHMRTRAERGVRKAARRLRNPVDAVIRFEKDGPTRRVEILLRAPRRRDILAEGRSRYFGPALAEALGKLEARAGRVKRTPQQKARRLARV